MDNTIKVSVVMPVYNGEKYLRQAILSVLNQTEKNFELIIINDGSIDSSEEIIKSFNDERIKYFKKDHSGLIDSLNFGIKQAQGEYVARFDADDICTSDRLEKQLSFFQNNPEDVMVGSCATKINENDEEIGIFNYPPTLWGEIKKYSLLHNPFIHSTVMFKRKLITTMGGYKNFKHAEDYELWTRIIYKYPCANISEPLLKYRIHTDQVTKTNNLSMKIVALYVRFLALLRFIF